jgi:hypothetical protein
MQATSIKHFGATTSDDNTPPLPNKICGPPLAKQIYRVTVGPEIEVSKKSSGTALG